MRVLAPAYREPAGAPTSKIADIPSVKAFLRLAGRADDANIQRAIDAVTDSVEEYLERPVRARTIHFMFDVVPRGDDLLVLPYGPVRSVDAVERFTGGGWVALDEADYREERLWSDSAPPPRDARVRHVSGQWDVEVDEHVGDPFRVVASCGWETVPAAIVDSAMRMIGDRLANRSAISDVQMYSVGSVLRRQIDRYRRTPIFEVL